MMQPLVIDDTNLIDTNLDISSYIIIVAAKYIRINRDELLIRLRYKT